MQFPKIAVFACALAAVVARADQDNPEQAAARAALVAHLFDVSAAGTVTNATVAPPTVIAPTVRAPVVKTPAVTAPMVAAPAVSTTTVVKPAAPAGHTTLHPVTHTKPAVAAKDTGHAAKKATDTKPVAGSGTANKSVQAAAKPAPSAKAASEFPPIPAPASPLPAAKQQKLQELLAKYKADQITPEEYHRQRSTILNGM